MDSIFEALHAAMPVLCIIGALVVIFKIIFVANTKGFSVATIFLSFFRVYKRSQMRAVGTKRKAYMRTNNYLNFYLYGLLALFIVLLIIYQDKMFG